uniref:NADH dehydrogenase subunit 6 n=1 Tax=Exitianus nanus TaxID=1401695 RepID=UPI0021D52611|nr:NADH dehydrogenase subunit 6 [Exitianus nanus]UXD78662.1 NADH dehydrogenase subunit 6 [Exitianus nanus]
MKLMFMKLALSSNTMILFVKTPMTMGMLLMIQTMVSTLIISKSMDSSWIPMVMFLMFIGGLLILFMYMSSIASNEKFTPNIKMLTIMIIALVIPLEELMTEVSNNNIMAESYLTKESTSMTKIYNKKTMWITIMLFLYLFLTMIVVSKIIKIHKGPLRAK